MLLPAQLAIGEMMRDFFIYLTEENSEFTNTKPIAEYVLRDVAKSIVWCPTTMFDEATNMLAAWQRNDTDTAATTPFKLPVICLALGAGYMPTGRDFGRRITHPIPVKIDADTKGRIFKLTTSLSDKAVQIVFFANDPITVYELGKAFVNYLDDAPAKDAIWAKYHFAGLELTYPMQIENPDMPVSAIPSDTKNIHIGAVNLNFHITEPRFHHPKDNEPNDGKGTDGDINDPHGYPTLQGIVYNLSTIL